MWVWASVVVLLGAVPLSYPPMRVPLGDLELSTWCLVLLVIVQLVSYGTDYFQRPLGQRAMAFAGGLLVYAGLLIPAHRWVLFTFGGVPPERAHVVSNLIIGDAYCLGPVCGYALRHSWLLAKQERERAGP